MVVISCGKGDGGVVAQDFAYDDMVVLVIVMFLQFRCFDVAAAVVVVVVLLLVQWSEAFRRTLS